MSQGLHEKQLHEAESHIETGLSGMGMDLQKIKDLQPAAYDSVIRLAKMLLPEVLNTVRDGGNVQTIDIKEHAGELAPMLDALRSVASVTDEQLLNALQSVAENAIQSVGTHVSKYTAKDTSPKSNNGGKFGGARL